MEEQKIPNRREAVWFIARVLCFRLQRFLRNIRHPVPLHRTHSRNSFRPTVAEVRTPLWTVESVVENKLQLGKIQNLRLAARAIDGVVIPRGTVFSFWRQVGRASTSKGYVNGRELREGCLIPAIGGGLCQLSNALYEAALQGGCEIVERHAHSRVVPGSAAAQGRDATVAWNYVDLRFRPQHSLRIEVKLTAQELVVRFRSDESALKSPAPAATTSQFRVLDPLAHTCTDCGAQSCFRHRGPTPGASTAPREAFLLDECWPEFIAYLEQAGRRDAVLAVPMLYGRYAPARNLRRHFSEVRTSTCAAMKRAISMRMSKTVPTRIRRQLWGSQQIAEQLAGQVPFDVAHVIVAQSFLPFLWRAGALGGRTFDVLMTRRPLSSLHRILDQAAARSPQRSTLAEFRAPEWMVEAEQEALANSSRIVTPHRAIARMFGSRAVRLPWSIPPTHERATGKAVVFPGPTVARKGAYEVRDALRDLNCELIPLGRSLEGDDFWGGIKIGSSNGEWLDQAAVVVQPALLEDNPRPLLRAIAAGIPVICTENCGVAGLPNVTSVEFGDVEGLRDAVAAALARRVGVIR